MKSHLIDHSVGISKPWLDKPSPRAALAKYLVYLMVFVGFSAGAVQVYFTYYHTSRRMVTPNNLCLQFDEDFTGPDPFGSEGRWNREVNMDGYGNGQFEMTTNSPNNSFVDSSGILHLVPTLTATSIGESNMLDGAVYNISGCSFNKTHAPVDPQTGKFPMDAYLNSCSAISNKTTDRLINPVMSARINTLGRPGGHMKYGLLEVRAKMPRGDWLWPAIWMMPVPSGGATGDGGAPNGMDGVYGTWPRSGEIDLVESRGNDIKYTARGRNYVQGSLHWGLAPEFDRVDKSYSWWSDRRKGFDEGWNTYRMEWTPSFIRVSVNSRLHTLLDYSFNKPFFDKGEFPPVYTNSTTGALTQLANPWESAMSDPARKKSAPFDQEFYLIINLAVGGRNGWFPEGQGDKPWLDRSATAVGDFWRAKDKWLPTWGGEGGEQSHLKVDYVKIWGECKK